MTRQQIKEKAKECLGKNIFGSVWLTAGLFYLIVEFAVGVVAGIPVLGIAAFIFLLPATYGVYLTFLKLGRGSGKVDFEDLFAGFKNKDLGGLVVLGILKTIFVFL
ncbi:MAG: hypothetical protein II797_04620, partial [Clostridia bacterium]|nr:hypothetical protein [Clostridia bacterium]